MMDEEAPRFLACGNWKEHPAHKDCLGVGADDSFAMFMRHIETPKKETDDGRLEGYR